MLLTQSVQYILTDLNFISAGRHIVFGLLAAQDAAIAPIRAFADMDAPDNLEMEAVEAEDKHGGRVRRRLRRAYRRARRRLKRNRSKSLDNDSIRPDNSEE